MKTIRIQLKKGWNWISINVANTGMTVGSVLFSLNPSEGDCIKSQTESATYYDGIGW